jgi:hypothetical protein
MKPGRGDQMDPDRIEALLCYSVSNLIHLATLTNNAGKVRVEVARRPFHSEATIVVRTRSHHLPARSRAAKLPRRRRTLGFQFSPYLAFDAAT